VCLARSATVRSDWLTGWMSLLWHLTNRRWNYSGYVHQCYSLHAQQKVQFAIHNVYYWVSMNFCTIASWWSYSHSVVLGVDAVVCHACEVWGYSFVMLRIVVEVSTSTVSDFQKQRNFSLYVRSLGLLHTEVNELRQVTNLMYILAY